MAQTTLTKSVENRIDSVWPVERWQNVTTIVAVSGGADSIALLHAMARLSGMSKSAKPNRLVVAHVDHGTRGEDSAADADFVKAEAEKLSLPFYLGKRSAADNVKVDLGSNANPSESSLRDFRYRCLKEAAKAHGARYIVTGHTLDDQIETVLFRILRGTGLRGLSGIPPFRKLSDELTLVRPMLSVSRAETHAYVNEIGQQHRVDASNDDSHYTRNFLRNELLPLARTKFPDVDRAIANLSEAATDSQNAMPKMIAAAQGAILVTENPAHSAELKIDCKKMAAFPAAVIIDALIDQWDQLGWSRGDINRATWNQVAQLIQSNDTRRQVINLPGNVRAERSASDLSLSKQAPD